MAGETGSAREEAERLVATVLAMAQQSGLGRWARPGGEAGPAGDAGTEGRAGPDSDAGAEGRARPDSDAGAEGRAGRGSSAGPDSDAGTASRAGEGRDDDSIAATGARIVDGLGTLGHTLAGMVGQLTGSGGGERAGSGERAAGSRGDAWSWATGAGGRSERPAGRVRYGWSTGSLECCVCPVCRAIASMRNPSPESAVRLATGAGDLASGVASVMRGLSAMSGGRAKPARTARPAPPPDPGVAWSAATRGGEPRAAEDLTPGEEESPWAAATRTAAREAEERRAAEKAAAREEEKRRAAEKATARKAAADKAAADKAAETAAAEKAAERAAAEKAEKAEKAGTAGPGSLHSGIDPEPSAAARNPRTPQQWGVGGDVWAAATADGPAMDHDDAGDEAGSGEV